jgi:hypothetical protein
MLSLRHGRRLCAPPARIAASASAATVFALAEGERDHVSIIAPQLLRPVPVFIAEGHEGGPDLARQLGTETGAVLSL